MEAVSAFDWVHLFTTNPNELIRIESLIKLYRKTPKRIRRQVQAGSYLEGLLTGNKESRLQDLAAIYNDEFAQSLPTNKDVFSVARTYASPTQFSALQLRVSHMRRACLLCVLEEMEAHAKKARGRSTTDDNSRAVELPQEPNPQPRAVNSVNASQGIQLMLSMTLSMSVCTLRGLDESSQMLSLQFTFNALLSLLFPVASSRLSNRPEDAITHEVFDFYNCENDTDVLPGNPMATALNLIVDLITTTLAKCAVSTPDGKQPQDLGSSAVSLLFAMAVCTNSLRLVATVMLSMMRNKELRLNSEMSALLASAVGMQLASTYVRQLSRCMFDRRLFTVRTALDRDQLAQLISFTSRRVLVCDDSCTREEKGVLRDCCIKCMRMLRSNITPSASTATSPSKVMTETASLSLKKSLDGILFAVNAAPDSENKLLITEAAALYASAKDVLIADCTSQFQLIGQLAQDVCAESVSSQSTASESGKALLLEELMNCLEDDGCLIQLLNKGSPAEGVDSLLDLFENALFSEDIMIPTHLLSKYSQFVCRTSAMFVCVVISRINEISRLDTDAGSDERAISSAASDTRNRNGDIEEANRMVGECGELLMKLLGAMKKQVDVLLRSHGRSHSNVSSSYTLLVRKISKTCAAQVTPAVAVAFRFLLDQLQLGPQGKKAELDLDIETDEQTGSFPVVDCACVVRPSSLSHLISGLESVGTFLESAVAYLGCPLNTTPHAVLGFSREMSLTNSGETSPESVDEEFVLDEDKELRSALFVEDTQSALPASVSVADADADLGWLQCLNGEVQSLRLSLTAFFIRASPDDNRRNVVDECNGWLEGDIFKSGLLVDDTVGDIASVLPFLRVLAEGDEANANRARLIQLMRAQVPADRRNAPTVVNRTVHAMCSALIWHTGLGMEALALSEGRTQKPSAVLIGVWKQAQEIRQQLDSIVANPEDEWGTEVLIGPSPASMFEKALLLLTYVPNQAVALSAGRLAVLTDYASLTTNLVRFVTTGPSADLMRRAQLLREKCVLSRSKGLDLASSLLIEATTDEAKLAVVRTLALALQPRLLSQSSDAVRPFFADLHGSSAKSKSLLICSWLNLTEMMLKSCADWLGRSGQASFGAEVCKDLVMFAVAGLARNYVGYFDTISQAEFLSFLSATVLFLKECGNSTHLPIRLCVCSAAEMLFRSICGFDVSTITYGSSKDGDLPSHGSESSLSTRLGVADSSKHFDLLNMLLGVVGGQLNRCLESNPTKETAPHRSLAPVVPRKKGSSSVATGTDAAFNELQTAEVQWLVPQVASCNPCEPGFLCPYEKLPSVHCLSFWLWRPLHSEDGLILTKAGPVHCEEDAQARAWGFISVGLQGGYVSLHWGRKPSKMALISHNAVPSSRWVHVSYRINVRDTTIDLFINGTHDKSSQLDSVMLNPPRDCISPHPWFFGQVPSYVDHQRAASCAIAGCCILAGDFSDNAIRALPQWVITILRPSTSLAEVMGNTVQLRGAGDRSEDRVANAFSSICPSEGHFCVKIHNIGAGNSGGIPGKNLSVGLTTLNSLEMGRGQPFILGASGASIGVCYDSYAQLHVLKYSHRRRSEPLPRPLLVGDSIIVGFSLHDAFAKFLVVSEDGTIIIQKKFPLPYAPLAASEAREDRTDDGDGYSRCFVCGASFGEGDLVTVMDEKPARILLANVADEESSSYSKAALSAWDLGLTLMETPVVDAIMNRETLSVLSTVNRICNVMNRACQLFGSQQQMDTVQANLLHPLANIAFCATSTAVRLIANKIFVSLLTQASPKGYD
jgi:hypothetical protein